MPLIYHLLCVPCENSSKEQQPDCALHSVEKFSYRCTVKFRYQYKDGSVYVALVQ